MAENFRSVPLSLEFVVDSYWLRTTSHAGTAHASEFHLHYLPLRYLTFKFLTLYLHAWDYQVIALKYLKVTVL